MCKCINLLRRKIEQRSEKRTGDELQRNRQKKQQGLERSPSWDLSHRSSASLCKILSLSLSLSLSVEEYWTFFLLDYATVLDNKIEGPVFQLIALLHLTFNILPFYHSFTILWIYSFNIRVRAVWNKFFFLNFGDFTLFLFVWDNIFYHLIEFFFNFILCVWDGFTQKNQLVFFRYQKQQAINLFFPPYFI